MLICCKVNQTSDIVLDKIGHWIKQKPTYDWRSLDCIKIYYVWKEQKENRTKQINSGMSISKERWMKGQKIFGNKKSNVEKSGTWRENFYLCELC